MADVFTLDVGVLLKDNPVILLVDFDASTFRALCEHIKLFCGRDIGVGKALDLVLVVKLCRDLEAIILLARGGVVFKEEAKL